MGTVQRILTWVVRGFLFVFVFLWGMLNDTPVTLKFFFGQSWQVPLALVLFVALGIGAALGVLAALQRIFAQRRELIALAREIDFRYADGARSIGAAPAPDAVSRALAE